MNILGKQSDLPFSHKSDRKKEKSMVSFTHQQNIICSQTLLDGIAHEQTITCRQLFAGHVVGSWSMKRKKNLLQMISLQMLYAEKVSSMFDTSCMNAPYNICDFFTKANSKHKHETSFSSSGNYYVQTSRLNVNQDSFSRFGAKLWNAITNEFCQLSKGALRKIFMTFCSR